MQVARAGRFGTKGLAVTFASDEAEAAVLNDVQSRFEVEITELPASLDKASYRKRHDSSTSRRVNEHSSHARFPVGL